MATATTTDTTIRVDPIRHITIELSVLGTTPLILHRMADKGLRELLLPAGRKTAADKASTLKHRPIDEFRAAAETTDEGPTLLALLSTAFKGAVMSAALDTPGASKAQIGRLLWVEGERVGVFGLPKLLMSVVRSADMNHTPDVRTRPIVPRWAATVQLTFVTPLLNEQSVVNLMAAAGLIQGVGDWRIGKGKGNYGQFTLTPSDNPDFLAICTEGRAAQEKAMADPQPYDGQSAELLSWFQDEAQRRGRLEVVA